MLSEPSIIANFPVETVPKGSVLLRRSAIGDCIYYIEAGYVALGTMGNRASDLESELNQIAQKGWLGMSCAALGLPSVVDAVAKTAVQFRRLPLAYFRSALSGCPAYVMTLFESMGQAQRSEQVRVLSRLTQDADSRIAAWLCQHARVGPVGVLSVHLQRKRDIAIELGIAPESFSRSLRKLRNMGLIAGAGRDISIENAQQLHFYAGLD